MKKKPVNHIYFAYGSNLHQEQMQKRCPDSKSISAAVLGGWQLTFRYGVCNIERGSGLMVHGALYWVSERDIKALDQYEGHPKLYKRKDFLVIDEKGQWVQAFAYYMNPGYPYQGPSQYYFDVVRVGFENWGLPKFGLYDAVWQALEKEGKNKPCLPSTLRKVRV